MDEWTRTSAFYHFNLLPNICIHSLREDEYSKMYIARDKCECGCSEWIEGKIDIIKPINGYTFPKKDVHLCKNCNEVRMADHIGIKKNEP